MQPHKKTSPVKSSTHEDISRVTQIKTIFDYLQNNVATASMVSEATGIYQKNICRYKRDLEEKGRLYELYKAECKKTGFKAWYISTNPANAPFDPQLKLFGAGTIDSLAAKTMGAK